MPPTTTTPSEADVRDHAQVWVTRFVKEFKTLFQLAPKRADLMERVNSCILQVVEKAAKTLQSIESIAFQVYRAFWREVTGNNHHGILMYLFLRFTFLPADFETHVIPHRWEDEVPI